MSFALFRIGSCIPPGFADKPAGGAVAEWSKAHAWKVCRRETVSRVRIPSAPPLPPFKPMFSSAYRGFAPQFTLRRGSPIPRVAGTSVNSHVMDGRDDVCGERFAAEGAAVLLIQLAGLASAVGTEPMTFFLASHCRCIRSAPFADGPFRSLQCAPIRPVRCAQFVPGDAGHGRMSRNAAPSRSFISEKPRFTQVCTFS